MGGIIQKGVHAATSVFGDNKNGGSSVGSIADKAASDALGTGAPAKSATSAESAVSSVPNPYTSSPGLQPGQAIPGMEWVSQATGPVAGDYYNQNRSVWESPSSGEVNAQGIVNQFSDPNNRPQGTQNTQNFYDQYMGNMPNINSDPGYGEYFQHAKDRSAESINQTMAARGAYGSSAANDQISRAFSDLDAQQAEKEADYNLRRIGENRAWQSLGGSLAGQADQNSLANASQTKDWENMLGQLGLSASQLGLSRTNAGMDAANAATAEKRNAGQDMFNNQQGMGDRLSENTMKSLMQMLGMDSEFFDKLQSGNLAAGNQAAANEQTNNQNTLNLIGTGLKGYDYFKNQQ